MPRSARAHARVGGAGRCRGELEGESFDRGGGKAHDAFDHARREGAEPPLQVVPAARLGAQPRMVDAFVREQDVHHREEEGASAPGRIATCSSAMAAVSVRRGSITMSLPPR